MLVAVNSKKRKYDPFPWMANGAELRRRAAAERAEQKPLATVADVIEKFKRFGVPIIDTRQKG